MLSFVLSVRTGLGISLGVALDNLPLGLSLGHGVGITLGMSLYQYFKARKCCRRSAVNLDLEERPRPFSLAGIQGDSRCRPKSVWANTADNNRLNAKPSKHIRFAFESVNGAQDLCSRFLTV